MYFILINYHELQVLQKFEEFKGIMAHFKTKEKTRVFYCNRQCKLYNTLIYEALDYDQSLSIRNIITQLKSITSMLYHQDICLQNKSIINCSPSEFSQQSP